MFISSEANKSTGSVKNLASAKHFSAILYNGQEIPSPCRSPGGVPTNWESSNKIFTQLRKSLDQSYKICRLESIGPINSNSSEALTLQLFLLKLFLTDIEWNVILSPNS